MLPTANGIPTQHGLTAEQESAKWMTQGHRALQFQRESFETTTRQREAAARDEIDSAVARANVASQCHMSASLRVRVSPLFLVQ